MTMVLAWVLTAVAFAIPFGVGVAVEDWLETREPSNARLVPLLYLWVPLATAMFVAFLLRAKF
jgi:hypothetical protein